MRRALGKKGLLRSGMMLSMLVAQGGAQAETWRDRTFRFAEGRAVRIVVVKAEVLVGSIDSGGVETADPDWTAAAHAKLVAQIEAQQRAIGNEIVFMPEQTGEQAKLIAAYIALFRVVWTAAAAQEVERGSLPARRAGGRWTLGPGAARIGEIGGGDYALVVQSYDAFATGGRKVFSVLRGKVADVLLEGASIHRGYAALVDLATGDLVWLNADRHAGGDPRTDDGAAKRVRQLLADFPTRERAR
ncbi:hypothetical protein ACT009_05015 [Sphingomonas sp. Tas61C01]|uniref:hypothetical protein n=1 Tax=Sphingomonas sp. Tas61C01 TaxID=3458297 RepID=UPI00403E8F69